eukprot:TRINITY_DN10515_c0_g1_i1.p1 TRINITY_DN10515_c0_g1~~TRINITY_DN10515_c0_g1_i1.p1  ORF type:complete len:217 (+),score=21.29 TRINITY_DN10515_c0_g1_i1:141-791(+)
MSLEKFAYWGLTAVGALGIAGGVRMGLLGAFDRMKVQEISHPGGFLLYGDKDGGWRLHDIDKFTRATKDLRESIPTRIYRISLPHPEVRLLMAVQLLQEVEEDQIPENILKVKLKEFKGAQCLHSAKPSQQIRQAKVDYALDQYIRAKNLINPSYVQLQAFHAKEAVVENLVPIEEEAQKFFVDLVLKAGHIDPERVKREKGTKQEIQGGASVQLL